MQQLAVAGLVRLGYKQNEASSWVEAVSTKNDGEPLDAEEIIRAVFAQRNEEIG
jgi:Holliday junction resolvasome RuvABC DNA-binding subunit